LAGFVLTGAGFGMYILDASEWLVTIPLLFACVFIFSGWVVIATDNDMKGESD